MTDFGKVIKIINTYLDDFIKILIKSSDIRLPIHEQFYTKSFSNSFIQNIDLIILSDISIKGCFILTLRSVYTFSIYTSHNIEPELFEICKNIKAWYVNIDYTDIINSNITNTTIPEIHNCARKRVKL